MAILYNRIQHVHMLLQPLCVQVLFSTWNTYVLLEEVSGFGQARGLQWFGNPKPPALSNPSHFRLGFAIFAHYWNKYLELFDTGFMLLRKKYK